MADIFISYSHLDRALASDLADFLDSCGYSVWWDYELVGGTKYRKQIKAQLDLSKAAIVIWTEHSVESEYVLDEAEDAKDQKKLLPVRQPELEFKKIPFGFRQFQTDPVTKPDLILRSLDEHKVVPSRPPVKETAPVVIGQQDVDPGIVAQARQFAAWEFIKDSQEPARFREFDSTYSGSPLAELARARLTKLADSRWPAAQNSSDPNVLRQFIADFPGGHSANVAHRILMGLESNAWYAIADKADAEALLSFLDQFPDGPFAIEARHRLDAFKTSEMEERSWADIVRFPAKDTLEAYLAAYPLGSHADEARLRLKEAIRSETRARRWAEIKGTAYSEQLRTFLNDYDSGPEVEEARALFDAKLRQREEEAWVEVANARHPTPIIQFLDTFPNAKHHRDAIALLERLPAEISREVGDIVKRSRNAAVADAASIWAHAQSKALPAALKSGAAILAAKLEPDAPALDRRPVRLPAGTPGRWSRVLSVVCLVAGVLLIAGSAIAISQAFEAMRSFSSYNAATISFRIAFSVGTAVALLVAALLAFLVRSYVRFHARDGALGDIAGRHALAVAVLVSVLASMQYLSIPLHRIYNNIDSTMRGDLGMGGVMIALPALILGVLMLRRLPYVRHAYFVLFSALAAVSTIFVVGEGSRMGPIPRDYFMTYSLKWYGAIAIVISWMALAIVYLKLRKRTTSARARRTAEAAAAA